MIVFSMFDSSKKIATVFFRGRRSGAAFKQKYKKTSAGWTELESGYLANEHVQQAILSAHGFEGA